MLKFLSRISKRCRRKLILRNAHLYVTNIQTSLGHREESNIYIYMNNFQYI